MSAGSVSRNIEQNRLTMAYQDWLRQQQQPWQAAGMLESIAPMQTPQQVSYGPPPIAGLLGGTMQLLSAPMTGGVSLLAKLLHK